MTALIIIASIAAYLFITGMVLEPIKRQFSKNADAVDIIATSLIWPIILPVIVGKYIYKRLFGPKPPPPPPIQGESVNYRTPPQSR